MVFLPHGAYPETELNHPSLVKWPKMESSHKSTIRKHLLIDNKEMKWVGGVLYESLMNFVLFYNIWIRNDYVKKIFLEIFYQL